MDQTVEFAASLLIVRQVAIVPIQNDWMGTYISTQENLLNS